MEKAAFESRAVLFGNVFGENVLVTNNRLLPGAPTMEIREVRENKKQFLELLLLADEEEAMIDRYLGRGTMYVLEDEGVKSECVVTDEGYVDEFCLTDNTLSTSGNTEQYTGHIINPLTGIYNEQKKVTSILSDNPLDAEILSTVWMIADDQQREQINENFKHIKGTIYTL